VLGVCGNSGNSSEPHLHFQMQDGQRADQSLGVEPVFSDVRVVRDDRVENAASR
jgi:murein DD-endopeptidase MepM/ murein hydrolase activator NlpD